MKKRHATATIHFLKNFTHERSIKPSMVIAGTPLMIIISTILIWRLFSSPLHAAGLLTPGDGSIPPLTLKAHHVTATIEDGYVVTQIDQTFANPHPMDLEALYTFPVPETASVAEFSLWINGKKVSGEVLEKQQAKQIYEEEKAAGRETGLTEKNDRNSFEIKVYPVKANQATRMRLVYIQPATVETGMGRYLYPLESGGVDEEESFWTANETVKENFSFVLKLRSSIPVDGVRVPGFSQAAISQISSQEWEVRILEGNAPTDISGPGNAMNAMSTDEVPQTDADAQKVPSTDLDTQMPPSNPSENQSASQSRYQSAMLTSTTPTPHGEPAMGETETGSQITPAATPTGQTENQFTLNKDIVVYWRQAADTPARVDMVTYKPRKDKRGTFMITITPGDELKPIREGRDWVFVLDRSGSMKGKFHTLLDGVGRALGKMSGNDRFRIIMFEERAQEVTNGYVPATKDNVKRMIQMLSSQRPGGGTNLFDGLQKGLLAVDADRTTAIVLVTDGVANVGVTKQKKFIELLNTKDMRLFTFMMGNSTNEFLLKHLAHASHGFAQSVSNSDDIVGLILSATGKVTHEAFHGAKLDIQGISTSDLATNNSSSLYRGEQLIVFGHYSGGGEAEVFLTAKVSGEKKRYATRFAFPNESHDHPEIERLWAYAAIQEIKRAKVFEEDERESKQAIINLSTQYGIVTDYTSMIVVRDEIFKKYNIERTNKKRLEIEAQARQTRAQAPVTSRRVDNAQPMYSTKQASHRKSSGGGFGGGALDLWFLLSLLPVAAIKLRKPIGA